jgi:DNA-binding winged helix-turn-helix (wHTH) protein
MDVICFGEFELDSSAAELRSRTRTVRLPEQPFEILTTLLERPGEVVTRDQLRKRLWPDGTVVDFEHSINAAMRRLREALGDAADAARYIETLRGRGYRLRASVKRGLAAAGAVIVLPFAHENGNEEMEFFSDRLTESITNHLSALDNLKVVAATSAFRYKRSLVELAVLRNSFSVRAMVAGRVAQRHGYVVVSAELVDVATETQLWGARFRRRASGLCAVQRDISRGILRQLRPRLQA